MNVVLMNGSTVLSKVITREEAESRIESLKMIYPKIEIKETDQEIKQETKINVIPEEVEDVGCAGGACTL